MKLYHGSSMPVERPDISFSRQNLDFGCGFYLTSFRDQAERWARRKTMRQGGSATVSVYEFKSNLKAYKALALKNNKEWVEFVCACRRGSDIYLNYDVICGSVANDKVYTAVDMYYQGLWNIEQTLAALSYYDLNDQLCIINQDVLDRHLSFLEAYEVQ